MPHPTLNSQHHVHMLIGSLLCFSLIIALFIALLPQQWHALPSLGIWAAGILLFPRLKKTQRIQCALLMFLGVLGLLIAYMVDKSAANFTKALIGNQLVITMILGVSFLRTVTHVSSNTLQKAPKGPNALLKTMGMTHLMGAVINMSSIFIVGDRLSQHKPLASLQGLTLLRAFSACAAWSPFFASMGLALTSAPGAKLNTLVLYGLPAAIAGMLFTYI
ncbi:MAG: hypothetical protein ACPGPF_07395 [Pontibacterium sp.]